MFNKIKNNIIIKKDFQIGLFEIDGIRMSGAIYKKKNLLVTLSFATYIPRGVEITFLEETHLKNNTLFKKMLLDYAYCHNTAHVFPVSDYKIVRNNNFYTKNER